MLTRCGLCGGENEVQPGQQILACSYCGSALAIEDASTPEHLILPHTRNDRYAQDALQSFLLSRNRGKPNIQEIEFGYLPFLMMEDEKGRMKTASASKRASFIDSIPNPPAGNYHFFDEQLAGDEKVVPADRSEDGTIRILHLPLYRITYSVGGDEWEATVMGESWQIFADELPQEGSFTLNTTYLLLAAGLFLVFLVIGKLISHWPARLVVLLLVSTTGFTAYTLRERLVKHR
ncbi:MAG: hypothetical protein JSV33_05490 [bacterium]|nr:MAG: hypothetical protein JSV33_05490 [bacterium]